MTDIFATKLPTLMPCAVATCLFSTSSDLFPTRIFWTWSGAYCSSVAMGYAFNRGVKGKARQGKDADRFQMLRELRGEATGGDAAQEMTQRRK